LYSKRAAAVNARLARYETMQNRKWTCSAEQGLV
jgi:hypothetical protein